MRSKQKPSIQTVDTGIKLISTHLWNVSKMREMTALFSTQRFKSDLQFCVQLRDLPFQTEVTNRNASKSQQVTWMSNNFKEQEHWQEQAKPKK